LFSERLNTPLACVDVCQYLLDAWSTSLMRPWHVSRSVHQ
jgi:hypothetical protein